MSEYLMPFNSKLNIEEKRKLFEFRNRLTKIPLNFGKNGKCPCGVVETIDHIHVNLGINKSKITAKNCIT